MKPNPTNREAGGLLAGFAIWSLTFLLLYGGHGTICTVGASGGIGARAILISLWTIMLIGNAALIVWFVRRLRSATTEIRFVRLVSLGLSIAAFVATLWIGLPVVHLEIC